MNLKNLPSWLIACGNILKKDMKTYYLKPPNISWGIIFPFAWTLMFFLRSQTPLQIRDILPGVIAMSVLFGTTSMLSVTITFERRQRSFERLLLAPLSLNALMLSKTSGAVLFGVFNAFIPVIFASLLTNLGGVNWPFLVAGIVLIAITSTFLGLLIAVSVREVFEAQTFSNFFRFPMIFLCGLFIPLVELPLVIRFLSYLLPLTYGADILKWSINNGGYLPSPLNFSILVVFSVALFALSTRNIKTRWIQ